MMQVSQILAFFGSAAAVGSVGRRHRSPDHLALLKREKELLAAISALDDELRKERDSGTANAARAEGSERTADELRQQAGSLAEEKVALEEVNQFLVLEKLLLCKSHTEAHAAHQQAEIQNAHLLSEVETLRSTNAAQQADFEGLMDTLRSQVADVVGRLLSHTISERDAALEVEALGCVLEMVDSSTLSDRLASQEEAVAGDAPSTSGRGEDTTRTLQVGDRVATDNMFEQFQRLAVRGAMPCIGSSAAMSGRVPIVSFPQLRAASSGGRLETAAPLLPARLTAAMSSAATSMLPGLWRVSDGGSSTSAAAPAADVGGKDQGGRALPNIAATADVTARRPQLPAKGSARPSIASAKAKQAVQQVTAPLAFPTLGGLGGGWGHSSAGDDDLLAGAGSNTVARQ